ncbi:uncharacterized protein LOC125095565 [Lutra lutra]|uniref:uncharacterized protein LOC125095565 n=1 Tax=Lutra lutra TaxID=9657 RepID=UPI001FD20BEC|nr:uncharacterized protein LOC125095565 [Lutra lutra]
MAIIKKTTLTKAVPVSWNSYESSLKVDVTKMNEIGALRGAERGDLSNSCYRVTPSTALPTSGAIRYLSGRWGWRGRGRPTPPGLVGRTRGRERGADGGGGRGGRKAGWGRSGPGRRRRRRLQPLAANRVPAPPCVRQGAAARAARRPPRTRGPTRVRATPRAREKRRRSDPARRGKGAGQGVPLERGRGEEGAFSVPLVDPANLARPGTPRCPARSGVDNERSTGTGVRKPGLKERPPLLDGLQVVSFLCPHPEIRRFEYMVFKILKNSDLHNLKNEGTWGEWVVVRKSWIQGIWFSSGIFPFSPKFIHK